MPSQNTVPPSSLVMPAVLRCTIPCCWTGAASRRWHPPAGACRVSARSCWEGPAATPIHPSPASHHPATAAPSSTTSPPTGYRPDCSREAVPFAGAVGETRLAITANTGPTHPLARFPGWTKFRDCSRHHQPIGKLWSHLPDYSRRPAKCPAPVKHFSKTTLRLPQTKILAALKLKHAPPFFMKFRGRNAHPNRGEPPAEAWPAFRPAGKLKHAPPFFMKLPARWWRAEASAPP